MISRLFDLYFPLVQFDHSDYKTKENTYQTSLKSF